MPHIEAHHSRKQYPRYTPMDGKSDISYGDPYEAFGINSLFGEYRMDSRVFMLKRESVIGMLQAGGDKMDLTADTEYRALRLIKKDEHGLDTGEILYVIYPNIRPYSIMHIDAVPIEHVEPNWPQGVEFQPGSLESALTNKEARTIVVNVEQIWRERGGNPKHKIPKTGGFGLKR